MRVVPNNLPALDPSTWTMRVLKNFVRCSNAYHWLKGEPMNKLIVMVGLPRSGKSTWAKASQEARGAPIVCPDAIRLALHGMRFLKIAEPMVWAIAGIMVRALFLAGHSTVIVDGCHVKRSQRDRWQAPVDLLVKPAWETWFKWIDTDQQTCLHRAELEKDTEIMPIIDRMTEEFEGIQTDELQLDPPAGSRVGA